MSSSAGSAAPSAHGLYVVQKHAAKSLHYDFRLEHDGVLLSWAVPKGPSREPRARRLAVQVEDHPLDYADFEGEIPVGNYGAGKVEIWDRGQWSPHGEVAAGLRRGRLAFSLHGGKLEGEWHLVRLAERSPGKKARPRAANWLLFRSPDDAAEPAARTAGKAIRPAGKRRVAPESASGSQAAGYFELATPAAAAHASHAANIVHTVEGVRITHPDRRVFADSRITKLDLARYWTEVWPWIEPHLADRPLAFLRCPEGAADACFFQKHWPGALTGVVAVDVSEPGESSPPQARVANLRGLVGLSQFGVVEIHLWGARARKLEYPDRLVMDLDPGPGVAWRQVVAGARRLRDLLAELGLESFPLLSGGKGVHVVAPLAPRRDWATVRAFAAALARSLATASPELYVDRATKSRRAGRIFVDYLRNGRGATAIAPYSPRARSGGPVATPITWAELARATPDRFTVATLPRRLAALAGDPWAGYFALRQTLTPAALAAVGLAAAQPPRQRINSSGRA